jgi:glucose-1-phosphate thymidylyltransferase
LKGIILHGGHGTRLRPLTHTGPKQLLPIANKPMSQYGIEAMILAGIKDIAIIVGGIGKNKVKEYYGDGGNFGVKFEYIEQDKPRGISHAISLCENFVGNEKFVVFLGDNILKDNIAKYIQEFEKSSAEASIVLCEVNNPTRFGIAEVKDGRIIQIVEKPKNPPSNLAVIGVYLLKNSIFKIIKNLKPSWRNELEITDALQMLLEQNSEIIYNTVSENWKDTGTPEDIIDANKIILKDLEDYLDGTIEDDVKISGKLMIGKNSVIKKGCVLEGPLIIGSNCIIDSHAHIGPNSSIGDNSKISKCRISDSIIMSDCLIDCKKTISKSIISTNSEITENNVNDDKILLLGEGTKITL